MIRFGCNTVRVVFFAIFAALVVGCQSTRSNLDQVAADPAPASQSIDVLVQAFDELAFSPEFGSFVGRKSVISKWPASVTIAIKGTVSERRMQQTRAQLAVVSQVTGLHFRTTSSDVESPEMSIVFAPKNKLDSVKISNVDRELIEQLAEPGRCFFLNFENPKKIIAASVVVINSELPRDRFQRCMVRMLYQATGIRGKGDSYPSSIFSDSSTRSDLSKIDRLLITVFHDSRISMGMSRAEALGVARKVIQELLLQNDAGASSSVL